MKIIFKTHFSACVFGFILLMACNTNDSAPTDGQPNAFIEDLIKKMTLEEKIGQLNLLTPGGAVTGEVVSKDVEMKIKTGQVGGIFGIRGADLTRRAQQLAVEQSRLGIPLITGMDVIHGHQTILPIPLGLSCSWDMSLIKQSAQMAAKEATADGLMWTFSPMVDIARDPRWGRISEGSGEDTYLGSKIAAAMVQGYQGTDLSNPMTMLACVKHYAAYGAAEGGRDYAAGDMSTLKLYNEYLPPYKAAVDAGVGSLMNSFNVVDYTPATANTHLLSQVLRKDWGFDGLIVTDYTSINEMVNHGIGDLQEVSARALRVGVDMDMVGEGFLTTLKKSLEEKKYRRIKLIRLADACFKPNTTLVCLMILINTLIRCVQKKIFSQQRCALLPGLRLQKLLFCWRIKNSILPLKNKEVSRSLVRLQTAGGIC